jgi:hypothetical protein
MAWSIEAFALEERVRADALRFHGSERVAFHADPTLARLSLAFLRDGQFQIRRQRDGQSFNAPTRL